MKSSIHEEDIKILHLLVSSSIASKYIKQHLEREMYKSTITVEDSNTHIP